MKRQKEEQIRYNNILSQELKRQVKEKSKSNINFSKKDILLKHNEEPKKNFYYIGFSLDTNSNRQYFRLYNDKDLGFSGTLADYTIESVSAVNEEQNKDDDCATVNNQIEYSKQMGEEALKGILYEYINFKERTKANINNIKYTY